MIPFLLRDTTRASAIPMMRSWGLPSHGALQQASATDGWHGVSQRGRPDLVVRPCATLLSDFSPTANRTFLDIVALIECIGVQGRVRIAESSTAVAWQELQEASVCVGEPQ